MKKFIYLALSLIVAFAAVEVNAKDATEKQMKKYEKAAEKSAKKRAKEFKKDKWMYSGSADLELKLVDHMLETEEFGGDGVERVVDIAEANSIVIGEKLARSNAEQDLAREIRTMLQGAIDTHTKSDGKYANDIYIDNWSARVSQELKSDLTKSFTLSKKNKNGTFWVRVYYIVGGESRRRAMDKIANEIKDDNELADAIRKAARGDVEED